MMKAIKRVLHEPLVHFLLLGLALFAAYSYFTRGDGEQMTDTDILLTPDELLQMTVYFEQQWQRPPNQEEFGRLLETRVQEEVLYREAIAMGLDKDDAIVRRRMAQKMKFLAEDVADAREPTVDQLRAWYAANSDIFAMPGRISFRQVYFSPDNGSQQAYDAARRALDDLAGQPIDSELAASLGDSIMLQDYFGDRSVEQLARELGPAFAQAVRDVEPGRWQGPIESGLGWHLVFVDSFEPGRIPDFSEVEPEVRTAWLAEQKETAWQEAYERMRAKYTVLLPVPADSEPAGADTAMTPAAGPADADN